MNGEMTIGELAKKAGVTTRTIRFYVSEGLLPPPQIRGRKNLYSSKHLTALRVITAMKANYLPLSRIALELENLTEEQMTELLAKIEGIQKQGCYGIAEMFPAPPSIIRDPQARLVKEEHAPYGAQPMPDKAHEDLPPPEYLMNTENWKKIRIRDGVELHFKAVRDEAVLNWLEDIVVHARRSRSRFTGG